MPKPMPEAKPKRERLIIETSPEFRGKLERVAEHHGLKLASTIRLLVERECREIAGNSDQIS